MKKLIASSVICGIAFTASGAYATSAYECLMKKLTDNHAALTQHGITYTTKKLGPGTHHYTIYPGANEPFVNDFLFTELGKWVNSLPTSCHCTSIAPITKNIKGVCGG